MDDKSKIDQQSGRPNRDQETERKPTQGSQHVNNPNQQGNVQSGQQDEGRRDDREKKSA